MMSCSTIPKGVKAVEPSIVRFCGMNQGYLPGFYVLPMQHLKMGDDGLSFDLIPTPDDLFNQPIPLKYRASGAEMEFKKK